MAVYITDWALDSYLNLKHSKVISSNDYKSTLRPDAELLHKYPTDPKFQNTKFWGHAKDKSGLIVQHGWKMKWHNFGNGKVQLRLGVAVINQDSYLCQCWIKDSQFTDKRECAKLKARIILILNKKYTIRGHL